MIQNLEDVVAQLARVQDEQANLAIREAALKQTIRALLPEPGSYPVGPLKVSVQPNRRFDPDKAADFLDPTVLPLVTVTTKKVDGKKVEALFPDVFEQAHTVYDNKIALR